MDTEYKFALWVLDRVWVFVKLIIFAFLMIEYAWEQLEFVLGEDLVTPTIFVMAFLLSYFLFPYNGTYIKGENVKFIGGKGVSRIKVVSSRVSDNKNIFVIGVIPDDEGKNAFGVLKIPCNLEKVRIMRDKCNRWVARARTMWLLKKDYRLETT